MQSWASLHERRWPGRGMRHFELRARRAANPRGRRFARADHVWARRLLDRLEQPATGFALLRMYLGLGLVVRGALFVTNPAVVQRVLTDADGWALPYLGAHAIAGAHLVGGALLALGYRARLAAAVQIPVLLGAAFVVHFREGLFTRGQSLEFSLLVLVLLVLYAVFGAGPLSLDHALRKRELMAAMVNSHSARPTPLAMASTEQPWDVVDEAGWESFPASDPPAVHVEEPKHPERGIVPAQPDPARQMPYSDARVELALVGAAVVLFSVLVALGHFAIAAGAFTAALILFGVWRIGRADFA